MNRRHRSKRWIIALGALLILSPIGEAAEMEHTDPFAGQQVFIEKGCIQCHSILGEGDPFGPDLRRVGEGSTFAKLAGLFWSHSPKMIELMEEKGITYPSFTDEEMEQVITYLYFLSYFEEPGDYFKGKNVFESKGCIKCHTLGGEGGIVGPSLDNYSMPPISAYLVQDMWNHGIKMTDEMKRFGIERPQFESGETAHLVAYIRGAAFNPQGPATAAPGNPNAGARVFEAKGCVQCHQAGGSNALGMDLSDPKQRSHTARDLAGRLWNHSSFVWNRALEAQEPIAEFEGTEMADLIAYLHFLPYRGRRGNSDRGAQLFIEKGCAACHGASGQEKHGPNLVSSSAKKSLTSLTASMWNHAPLMREMLKEKAISWPQFSEDEMEDILSYLQGSDE